MVAGALGLGVVAALGISAVAVAHQGSGAAVRSTKVELAGVVKGPAASGDSGHGTESKRTRVHVDLKDVHGKRIAQVDIVAQGQGGNRVTVQAWGLTPGFHAIHIHAVGVCDPAGAKAFASAGGHFNPTGKPEGMQAGAFPVLLAGANGQAQAQFTDGNFALRDLFGPSGTAIVIHAAADNYANIPPRYSAGGVAGPDAETQMTGDAGARIACGVLSAPRATPSSSPSPSTKQPMPTMSGM
jgi:Cu-Zn family superoxide dismutase